MAENESLDLRFHPGGSESVARFNGVSLNLVAGHF
jgi:hypothetical protein